MKYHRGGKEKGLAFGLNPEVTLKAARDEAADARKVMQAGVDPGALRKPENAKAAYVAVNALEAVARAWLEHQSGRWEQITLYRITASFETYIFEPLGEGPVAAVKAGEIMAAVKRSEQAGASDQAGRVLQRVSWPSVDTTGDGRLTPVAARTILDRPPPGLPCRKPPHAACSANPLCQER